MLTIAIIIFAASVIFLGLASIIFRIRAFANKPAWNGPVIPLGVIGFILLVVSLVLIYLNYPQYANEQNQTALSKIIERGCFFCMLDT